MKRKLFVSPRFCAMSLSASMMSITCSTRALMQLNATAPDDHALSNFALHASEQNW
jgi:hypothetical protein